MPIYISNKKFYSTKEAADQIERSRDTLLRWFRLRVVGDVQRDKHGNRIFTDTDIAALIKVRDDLQKKKLMRGVR